MILSNWRIRLLHISLTGMEVCWLLPVLAAGRSATEHAPAQYLYLLFIALLWMLTFDLVDLLKWPQRSRTALLVGAYALATTLWLWIELYQAESFFRFSWLAGALRDIVDFENGITPQTVVFGISTWLWLRAAWSTRRNLTSLAVEHNVRNGLILLLAGGWLVQATQNTTPGFWLPSLYMGFGISALALARSDERHALAHVRGGAPPVQRMAQFIGVAIGITALAFMATWLLPGPLSKGLSWLGFVVELAIILLQLSFVAALILGAQFSNWLRTILNLSSMDASKVTMPNQRGVLEVLAEQLEQTQGRDITLPLWALNVLKYVPIVILVLVVILVFVLINRSIYRRRLRADAEDESEAGFSARDALRNGLKQLRNLADMSRRFRLGEGLLAAISVEAIYANVCRLAARHGEPRPKSLPAESYLERLRAVFVGLDNELERITQAYMLVHYGDQKVRAQDLLNLQRDYQRLRRAATKTK